MLIRTAAVLAHRKTGKRSMNYLHIYSCIREQITAVVELSDGTSREQMSLSATMDSLNPIGWTIPLPAYPGNPLGVYNSTISSPLKVLMLVQLVCLVIIVCAAFGYKPPFGLVVVCSDIRDQ